MNDGGEEKGGGAIACHTIATDAPSGTSCVDDYGETMAREWNKKRHLGMHRNCVRTPEAVTNPST